MRYGSTWFALKLKRSEIIYKRWRTLYCPRQKWLHAKILKNWLHLFLNIKPTSGKPYRYRKPKNSTSMPTELDPNGLLSVLPANRSSQKPSSFLSSSFFSRKCSNLKRPAELTAIRRSSPENTLTQKGLKFKITLRPLIGSKEADSFPISNEECGLKQ